MHIIDVRLATSFLLPLLMEILVKKYLITKANTRQPTAQQIKIKLNQGTARHITRKTASNHEQK